MPNWMGASLFGDTILGMVESMNGKAVPVLQTTLIRCEVPKTGTGRCMETWSSRAAWKGGPPFAAWLLPLASREVQPVLLGRTEARRQMSHNQHLGR